MGGLFSHPSIPQAPPVPPAPPAAPPPSLSNPTVAQSASVQRARAAAAAGGGLSGTITNVGGAGGLTQGVDTAPRSLLG